MKAVNKNIILLTAIALGAVLYFTYKVLKKEKVKYSWHKTYEERSDEPYDFAVFRSLLSQKAGSGFTYTDGSNAGLLSKALAKGGATYVFAGRSLFINQSEINALLDFASAGNTVFIAAEALPDTLLQVLSYFASPLSTERFNAPDVRVEMTNPHSELGTYRFRYRGSKGRYGEATDWYFLEEKTYDVFQNEGGGKRYIPLGSINGHIHHARFKFGKGTLVLHTAPVLFSNYALSSETGFAYLNEVFGGIRTHRLIYDTGPRTYKEDAERVVRQSDSPLTYILSQTALRWAWYVFLLTVLLFFIFRAKRRQRMIPVLETKKNTGTAFIETLGNLFYRHADHARMAEVKMQLFQNFIRHTLRVSLHDTGPETMRQIALKSGVPQSSAEAVFAYYKGVIMAGNGKADAEDLIELHRRISEFYKIYRQKH